MRHLTNNPAEVYSLVFALGLDGCLIETLKKTGNLSCKLNDHLQDLALWGINAPITFVYQVSQCCLTEIWTTYGSPRWPSAAQNEENDFSSHQALVNWQDTLYAKTQGNWRENQIPHTCTQIINFTHVLCLRLTTFLNKELLKQKNQLIDAFNWIIKAI